LLKITKYCGNRGVKHYVGSDGERKGVKRFDTAAQILLPSEPEAGDELNMGKYLISHGKQILPTPTAQFSYQLQWR
jgi:hypothetical protein